MAACCGAPMMMVDHVYHEHLTPEIVDRIIEGLLPHLDADDILIDPLTFPIATGQEETRRDGLETIDAIRAIERGENRRSRWR